MLYNEIHISIHLAKKPSFHSNTKHIQLTYHFIRYVLDEELLKLEKIHTSQNPADILTKGVAREKLSSYSVSVGLQEWRWKYKIFQVQGPEHSPSSSVVVELLWSVSKWEIVGCGAWYSRCKDIIQLCLYPRCTVHSFPMPWGLGAVRLRKMGVRGWSPREIFLGCVLANNYVDPWYWVNCSIFPWYFSPIKESIVTRLCMVL